MVEKLKVAETEQVVVLVLINSGSKPDGVDSEELAKLVDDIVLLLVGPGIRRNPEFLGIVCNLEVDETQTAKGEHRQSSKH